MFVGHAAGDVNFMVYLRDSELPLFTYNVSGGKRLVVNRKMKFEETFELTDPIPAWAGIVFRSAEKSAINGTPGVPHLGITFRVPRP